jgi:hypothetical protein
LLIADLVFEEFGKKAAGCADSDGKDNVRLLYPTALRRHHSTSIHIPSKSAGLPDSSSRKLTAVHTGLIGLMTRHAQALSSRHPPYGDELAGIVLEMGGIVRLLQGLCLMSRECKEAVGQQHVLEVSSDLISHGMVQR